MRHLLIIASAAVMTLAAVPASYAQSRTAPQCQPGQTTSCERPAQQPSTSREGRQSQDRRAQDSTPQKPRAQESRRVHDQRAAPRAGDNGRGGQPFQRAADSRFKAPPRGQEYRVVNEHLVLVDSDTLKIVTVLGLMSSLLN